MPVARFSDASKIATRPGDESRVKKSFVTSSEGVPVLTFSASRDSVGSRPPDPKWTVTVETRPGFQVDISIFDELKALLPLPRFSGYQARSLHQQGLFKPTDRKSTRLN